MSLKALIKRTKLYYPAAMLKSTYKDTLKILWFRICRLFPVDNNKVVCSSFLGKSYSAEPLKVTDELIRQNMSIEIIWVLSDGIEHSKYVKTVKPNSYKHYFELATAGIWVDNCRKPCWIKKRDGQLYIQTWHGAVYIKAVEKDAQTTLHPFYKKSGIADSRNADFLVMEAAWREDSIRDCFWYSGELIKGEFKSVALIDKDGANSRVRGTLGIDADKHIMLYVPTFRNDKTTKHYLKQFDIVLDQLSKCWGGNWVAVLRLHPNISEKASEILYNDQIINGTSYPSIDDLIATCDLLISDYSGCIFYGFRAKKRVILYTEDLDEYLNSERHLYFKLEQLPAPYARSTDELLAIIQGFDDAAYEFERDRFVASLGYYEADAAKICADIIKKRIESLRTKEMK